MLRTGFALMILVFACLPAGLIYAQQPSLSGVKDEIEKVIKNTDKELKGEIKRLEYDVKAIQRDQMNYKIEKDMLKEIYSSNLQAINVVIALVLVAIGLSGVFFGYIGFRNIAKTRKDHAKEIRRIKKLRSKFNAEIEAISVEYERIKKSNEIQDRKIGELQYVLETQRLEGRNALEDARDWATRGLRRYPDSALLWTKKGELHFALLQYDQAIEAFTEATKLDPNNEFAVANLLEACLFTGKIEQYETVLKRCANVLEQLNQERNNLLLTYLEALKTYQTKDLIKMKNLIRDVLMRCPEEQPCKMMTWGFHDVDRFLDSEPNSEEKALLKSFIEVVKGEKAPADLLSKVTE